MSGTTDYPVGTKVYIEHGRDFHKGKVVGHTESGVPLVRFQIMGPFAHMMTTADSYRRIVKR